MPCLESIWMICHRAPRRQGYRFGCDSSGLHLDPLEGRSRRVQICRHAAGGKLPSCSSKLKRSELVERLLGVSSDAALRFASAELKDSKSVSGRCFLLAGRSQCPPKRGGTLRTGILPSEWKKQGKRDVYAFVRCWPKPPAPGWLPCLESCGVLCNAACH